MAEATYAAGFTVLGAPRLLFKEKQATSKREKVNGHAIA